MLNGERECPVCEQEALRPDIVLFGEAPRHMRRIEQALQACDVFLAIGTSDTVYPAAGLVDIAIEAGAQAHQLNLERTVGSHRYGACHIGPATTVVPPWVDALLANRLA